MWRVACFYKSGKENKVDYKYIAGKNAAEAIKEIKKHYKKYFSYRAYREY